jgi:hypothetical protein
MLLTFQPYLNLNNYEDFPSISLSASAFSSSQHYISTAVYISHRV